MSVGFVSLVGAGPGDPGLLTLHGQRALAEADVVLYDYLVHPSILDMVRPAAELVYVGKKGGTTYIPQEELTGLLLRHARRGGRVVRLKGGDPFVFGRGGEEALACARAGIPFEVVPGISSAMAGPAYAGIPVTHRGKAVMVSLITGHEDPRKPASDLDWDAIARAGGTLVFLMSMGNLEEVAERLMAGGRAGDTPAAAVQWATRSAQRTVAATLATLAPRCREEQLGAPAIVVVGGVASLRDELAWFESRPLFGRRILVTRAREQAGSMVSRLRQLGAEPVLVPAIRIEPPENPSPLREALTAISDFDYVVFTSPNGVRFFFEALGEMGYDARSLGGVRVVAIGPVTARALRDRGVLADFVPDTYTSQSLLSELAGRADLSGQSFLLPRTDIAPPELASGLTERGASVTEVETYRTVHATLSEQGAAALAEGLDGATFLSPSAVTAFFDGPLAEAGAEAVRSCQVFSIGPVTTEALTQRGVTPVEAPVHTADGLLDTLVDHFRGNP